MSADFICKKCNILIKWHEPASILNNKVYCETCANHFKQQTERVENYDRKMISLEDNKHYVAEIEQQNKRYREALNGIKDELNMMSEWSEKTINIVRLVDETLEGESDE